jgi:hypothetical protein
MRIRQTVNIHAPASKVWDFVADPQRVKAWNPKLKNVEKISLGSIGFGTRYEASYELNGKVNPLVCEVVAFDPYRYLKVLCSEKNMTDAGWTNRQVTEEYFLKEEGMNTFLEQIVTIQDPRIPLWAVMLINFIMAFGKPVEKTYLGQLKDLVEAV